MKFKIEGYDTMTAEEKLAALENYEPDMSGYVKKDVFDKTASEAASYKKQLREKQTDDEVRAQKEAEEKEALLAELQSLRKEKQLSGLTADALGAGFDKELAAKTAQAIADGDFKKLFQNIKSLVDTSVKNVKTEVLQQTPAPAAGGVGDAKLTLEAFRKMDARERFEFSQNHPEEYKALYGGNE